MLDYPKWRDWLRGKARQIGDDGFKTEFQVGSDDSPKPGMTMGIVGLNAMGSFESWVTGETDFTIMAPPSPAGKMVSHRWGLVLNDETFEATFREFIEEFHKFESLN
jgi:hypothetical protein